jgi:AraC-like DNA-binding protein
MPNATFTYNPIQVPFLLNTEFKRNVLYRESCCADCSDFVVCFWEMEPVRLPNESVGNIIVPDACIDLLFATDTDCRVFVGFAGMRRTEFDYPIPAGSVSFGFRLRPGAFHHLTGLSAETAMDGFVPLEEVAKDFDAAAFFALPVAEQKTELRRQLFLLIDRLPSPEPSEFMRLFEQLMSEPPDGVSDICAILNYSPKQCQRLFARNYGLSPKMTLGIIRFQTALAVLASPRTKPSDVLRIEGYYDQPHLIKDLKRTIGITPTQLIAACRKDGAFIQ